MTRRVEPENSSGRRTWPGMVARWSESTSATRSLRRAARLSVELAALAWRAVAVEVVVDVAAAGVARAGATRREREARPGGARTDRADGPHRPPDGRCGPGVMALDQPGPQLDVLDQARRVLAE